MFAVPIEVGDFQGTRFERVEALVDSGASHSRIPRSVLTRLGVVPHDRMSFRIADESIIEYDVDDTQIRIDGRTRVNPVVFGEDGSQPLLGATTLEIFGLGVDPVGKRLIPVVGIFM